MTELDDARQRLTGEQIPKTSATPESQEEMALRLAERSLSALMDKVSPKLESKLEKEELLEALGKLFDLAVVEINQKFGSKLEKHAHSLTEVSSKYNGLAPEQLSELIQKVSNGEILEDEVFEVGIRIDFYNRNDMITVVDDQGIAHVGVYNIEFGYRLSKNKFEYKVGGEFEILPKHKSKAAQEKMAEILVTYIDSLKSKLTADDFPRDDTDHGIAPL